VNHWKLKGRFGNEILQGCLLIGDIVGVCKAERRELKFSAPKGSDADECTAAVLPNSTTNGTTPAMMSYFKIRFHHVQLAFLMTIRALFVRCFRAPLFLRELFVAAFTVFVIGNVQLFYASFAL
jgi:hypothetical protein